jgi:hypothetical protein
MILGRSPSTWAALVAAALNVAVVVLHVALDVIQVGALNAFALILIALIANSPLTDHQALADAAVARK